MCIREETRSPCRRSISSGMNICRIRASSRPRRSATRHSSKVSHPKKGNIEGQSHVLAGASVSGTSQSIVNNLSICSRALDTRSCILLLEKHWRGREQKSAYPVVLEPCCVRIPARLRSLQRLALRHAFERFPSNKELAIIQIFCRAFFGRTDSCQFWREHVEEQTCHIDSSRELTQCKQTSAP